MEDVSSEFVHFFYKNILESLGLIIFSTNDYICKWEDFLSSSL